MNWIILILAGLCEVGFSFCLGKTKGVFAGAFRSEEFVQESEDRSNPWFILLYRQKWFREMVKERWQELGGLEAVTELVNQEKQLIKV